jgi:hypothetical protein
MVKPFLKEQWEESYLKDFLLRQAASGLPLFFSINRCRGKPRYNFQRCITFPAESAIVSVVIGLVAVCSQSYNRRI